MVRHHRFAFPSVTTLVLVSVASLWPARALAAPTPPPGFPGPTDTGYKNAPGYPGSLTPFTGTIQSNQTYKFYDFPSGLYLPQNLTNVTFYGCRFAGSDASKTNGFGAIVYIGAGDDNITFDYSTIEPDDVSAPPPVGQQITNEQGFSFGLWVYPSNAGQLTFNHMDIWGFGNNQFFTANNQAKPFTFENSWMHDTRFCAPVGCTPCDPTCADHTDGLLNGSDPTSWVVITHNTMAFAGTTNIIALQDSHISNATITYNYLAGDGQTVCVGTTGATNTNVTFAYNTLGNDYQPYWGPLYGWPGGTGNVWKCNTVSAQSNGWVVPSGNQYTAWVPNVADNGKFWLPQPNYMNPVSATDYLGNADCSATFDAGLPPDAGLPTADGGPAREAGSGGEAGPGVEAGLNLDAAASFDAATGDDGSNGASPGPSGNSGCGCRAAGEVPARNTRALAMLLGAFGLVRLGLRRRRAQRRPEAR